jgi:hypothetical protein
MGYDYSLGYKSIEIPLYYLYTPIALNVYHVNIASQQASGTIKGNDNVGCGHLTWPCLTIIYSLMQSGNVNTKKVGII